MTARKQPTKTRSSPRSTDRKLREKLARDYSTMEPVAASGHVELLDAIFRWIKDGSLPAGTKPGLHVVAGNKAG